MPREVRQNREREQGPIIDVEATPVPENRGEQSPEQTVASAVGDVEKWDKSDPIFSLPWVREASKWVKEHKDQAEKKYDEFVEKYPKTAYAGELAVDVGRVGGVLIFKILGGLIEFAKKAIAKKGKITIKEGYEIGKDMFNFEPKKEKK